MKHVPDLKNQDSGESLVPYRPPVELPAANIQPQGGGPVEEDSNMGHVNSRSPNSGSQQSGMELSFSIFCKRDNLHSLSNSSNHLGIHFEMAQFGDSARV